MTNKTIATLAPRWFTLILVLCAILVAATPTMAQATDNVVYGVLFYSPSCPHCHTVINEVLPPLMEQYGDQLQLIGIDVSQEQGQALYQSAVAHYEIPQERLGVPTLIVGKRIMVGSDEIPQLLPLIIEEGLSVNGIDWPDFPGMEVVLESLAASASTAEESAAQEPADAVPAESAETLEVNTSGDTGIPEDQPIWMARFLQDPTGNGVAVAVLLGLLLTLGYTAYAFYNGERVQALALAKWLIPGLSLAGVIIAGYLSYVEISADTAVCGPVGDCNAVQTSPYATLFGLIPVGVVGLIGYAGILGAWAVAYYGPARWHAHASLALWGMAVIGVLFSTYLTFLEPFVIGATCMWCIGSALVMGAMLIVTTPGGVLGWNEVFEQDELDEDSAPTSGAGAQA